VPLLPLEGYETIEWMDLLYEGVQHSGRMGTLAIPMQGRSGHRTTRRCGIQAIARKFTS